MELFPYTLIRLGGNSFEEWDQMDFGSTIAVIKRIAELKEDIQISKEQLSDNLFSYIEQLDDGGIQNTLQNLRRDIYNNRRVRPGKLNKALGLLNDDLAEQVNAHMTKVEKLKELTAEGAEVYDNECNQNRVVFKTLVADESLQKGLVLSSKTLLDQTRSYLAREIDKFRTKEHKTEQGIMKYLTRMYTKTSPFSTFTNLSMARFDDLGDKAYDIKHNTEKEISSHIRINNYLLKFLQDLLKCYREAYLHLPLRPNPTVEQFEDHFLYLTNDNNIESFQRIPVNPVVEYILGMVREEKAGIRFQELINLLGEGIDAEAEELESYVKQLIDYGFLEYNFGVSGIDPDWDVALIKSLTFLSEQKVAHINELIEILISMRTLGNRYAESDTDGRRDILIQAFDTFKGICYTIHEAAGLPEDERKTYEERRAEQKAKQEELKAKEEAEGKDDKEDEETTEEKEDIVFKHQAQTYFNFKPEQMFYEDTTREVDAVIDSGTFGAIFSKVNNALKEMDIFKGGQDERLKMKEYFIKAYDQGADVNLLTFYEDYYRDFKKPEKEREEKALKLAQENAEKEKNKSEDESEDQAKSSEDKIAATPEVINAIQELRGIQSEWTDKCEELLGPMLKEGSDTININEDLVRSVNQNLSREGISSDEKSSFGSFAQFYVDEADGKAKVVLNSTFSGYGKMLSRFLHIFDGQITDTVREWNSGLQEENSMFIENCDGSYFNANLHPPLLPNEIWMPGGHNTLPVEQQRPITDFIVQYDAENNELCLRDKSSKKQVYVFDLGFQSIMGRSQLFQVLERFSDAKYRSMNPLTGSINKLLQGTTDSKEEDVDEKKKEAIITINPRLIYDEDIIIQRKNWYVPKVLIPMKESLETDWEYFLKLNLWRRENNMPDEVFIFINPNRWNKETENKEAAKKLTRDDYKPQYIHFDNPLLVKLFEKSVTKVPYSLKIEEMLPNSSQMIQIDKKRFVSEFVVQWYNNKN